MIKNYIKTAWRNLKSNKVFSFINVFGLSVGLTCCMFIGAYLYSELTYDTYPANARQIYRVGVRTISNGGSTEFPSTDIAVGEGIKSAFPEVLAYTRISNNYPLFIKYGDKQFKEERVMLADPDFFDMFSIPLVEGNSKTALAEPNSMVITKEIEKKYFGNTPGLNKMLSDGRKLYKVTGVIDKVPDNSHFHGDFFLSMSTEVTPAKPQTWSNVGIYTYLLLNKGTDPKKLEARFPQLVAEHVVPEIQHDMGVSLAEAQKSVNTFLFYLMPLTDIHLHSATKYELEPNGDIQYVYIFGALALFILLLACINFTNLATASSAKRSKEIGIRKVLGSEKDKLVWQFLTESIMLTLLALVLALGAIYLLLPYFNNLAAKHITMSFFFNYRVIALEIGLALLVGFIAGIYPAFFLSSFKILSVLKSNGAGQSSGRGSLRSTLIVLQFAISTSLIIATFIVYQQLHYMQNTKLGYNKEQVLVLHDTYALYNNIEPFKQELLNNNNVVNATISGNVPGSGNFSGTEVYAKDIADKGSRSEIQIAIFNIDNTYIPTLGMQLLKGRNFYPGNQAADTSAVIVNETAVQSLGWGKDDPIGKVIIRSGNKHYTVVGLVKDFHFTSAKQKIGPLMMVPRHNNGSIMVKIKAADAQALIANVKKQWEAYNTGIPFSYSFLDEQFAKMYTSEEHFGEIFTTFSGIAIIIACLGLFGLAAFMIRQRVKEIGIRKVLGASAESITFMLTKEFLKLVLIAAVIAFPVTWFAMSKWLQSFAYRMNIQWWVFVAAAAIAMLIAFVTISFQTVRAAIANPVKSLRSE
ncbi:MAG: ABC transporter permease [Mucilaginibacter sp.]